MKILKINIFDRITPPPPPFSPYHHYCYYVTAILIFKILYCINTLSYVSVVSSLFGRNEVISGRPRSKLPLLGHGRFEQVRVWRVRYSGRVRRVTAVPRTEIRIRYRYDYCTVFFTHGSHCVRIVRVWQMFLKNRHVSFHAQKTAAFTRQWLTVIIVQRSWFKRQNILLLLSSFTSASSNVFKTNGFVSAPVNLGLPFRWVNWWLPREDRRILNGDPGKLRLVWN